MKSLVSQIVKSLNEESSLYIKVADPGFAKGGGPWWVWSMNL